jgi:hypothetical protein
MTVAELMTNYQLAPVMHSSASRGEKGRVQGRVQGRKVKGATFDLENFPGGRARAC